MGAECSEGPRELSEENRGWILDEQQEDLGEHQRGTGGNTAGVQGSTGNLGRVSEEALPEDREEQWG